MAMPLATYRKLYHNRYLNKLIDGDQYQKIRGVLFPFYSPKNQAGQFPKMVKIAKSMVEGWGKIPDTTPIDMRDWLIRYSLEVAARGASNLDLNIMDPSAVKPKLAVSVPTCLREASLRSIMVN